MDVFLDVSKGPINKIILSENSQSIAFFQKCYVRFHTQKYLTTLSLYTL